MIRIFLITLVVCVSAMAVAGDDGYTLYLVRHAEKVADGSRDPVLTPAGQQRSANLARWLRDRDIQDVWSSDYHRTLDTVAPLLAQRSYTLKIYDPRDQSKLARQLLENKHAALVVGHSNTIPELARLLCRCDISDMPEEEHDRLIVIHVAGAGTRVETLQQKRLFQER